MDAPGRIEALWIKRARRGPMDAAETLHLVAGEGVAGGADRSSTRQVTLIEREVFDRVSTELGVAVDPAVRRANVLVSGISLKERRNERIRLGSCVIELVGETRPCERMDEAVPGLRAALSDGWGGGAYGRVVEGGEIHVGDDVRLEPAVNAAAS